MLSYQGHFCVFVLRNVEDKIHSEENSSQQRVVQSTHWADADHWLYWNLNKENQKKDKISWLNVE